MLRSLIKVEQELIAVGITVGIKISNVSNINSLRDIN